MRRRRRRRHAGDRTYPNSGRPLALDARRPARGSRACIHPRLPESTQRTATRDRARVQRTAPFGTTASSRNAPWGHAWMCPERARRTGRVTTPGAHARIPTMSSQRDQRRPRRPRSPSTGRPARSVRPRDPGPIRLSGHRPIQRSGGLPIVFRIALALAVLALGAGILYIGANGIGAVVSAIGATSGLHFRTSRRPRHPNRRSRPSAMRHRFANQASHTPHSRPATSR